jgi:predicted RNA-binding protein with PIN domain
VGSVVYNRVVNALIDGYNLLHAIGLAGRNLPPKGLARARTFLLEWLADRCGDHALRVIFDGQGNSRSSVESDHRGVKVRFSFQQTADELIEVLVRADAHPAKLSVVSNDRQVQDAGRQRGCVVFACEEFIDALIAEPKAPSAAPPPADVPASEAEMAEWLAVFSQPKPRPRK